jgi:hypothetical protein
MGFSNVLVLLVLNRRNWTKRLPVLVAFMAEMWVLDRTIRIPKMAYHLLRDRVAVHPLPGDETTLLALNRRAVIAALHRAIVCRTAIVIADVRDARGVTTAGQTARQTARQTRP